MRLLPIALLTLVLSFTLSEAFGAQKMAALTPGETVQPESGLNAKPSPIRRAAPAGMRWLDRAKAYLPSRWRTTMSAPASEATVYVAAVRGNGEIPRLISPSYRRLQLSCRAEGREAAGVICEEPQPIASAEAVEIDDEESFIGAIRNDASRIAGAQTSGGGRVGAVFANLATYVTGAGKPSANVYLFVHGFNNSESEAVRRAASLNGNISKNAPLEGVSVAYSWPSAKMDKTQHPLAYLYDLQSAIFSRDQLAHLASRLRAAGRLQIFAHSMGCWLTMEAVRQIALSNDLDLLNNIEHIFLISPDIDRDVFGMQLRDIASIAGVAFTSKITVLAGTDDFALRLSGFLASKKATAASFGKLGWQLVTTKVPTWLGDDVSNRRVGQMPSKELLNQFGENSFSVAVWDTTNKTPEKGDAFRHFKATDPVIVSAFQLSLVGRSTQEAIQLAEGGTRLEALPAQITSSGADQLRETTAESR